MWPIGPSREELFLLISLTPRETRAWLLGADQKNGVVHVRHRFRPEPGTSFATPVRAASRLATAVIVGADPSLAATAMVPISLVRERIGEPLVARELEELLGSAVGNALNRARAGAAEEIGATEVDALLMRGRVVDFRLDGHRVVNPLGFRPQRIDAALELTFSSRPVLSALRRLHPKGEAISFVETGAAGMTCLERVPHAPSALFAVGERRSALYRRSDHGLSRTSVTWGSGAFPGAIAAAWGVDDGHARAIYARYGGGRYSPAARKHIAQLLTPPSGDLVAFLQGQEAVGRTAFDHPETLPFPLPFRKGKLTLEESPLAAVLERYGISVHAATTALEAEMSFATLAPFLAYYFDRSEREVDRWLGQRLHWLGAPMA